MLINTSLSIGVDIVKCLALIICFIINIFICFGIPIGYLIYLILTKKQRVKYFLCGMLVFLISQVFLRIPIIQKLLPKMNWYIIMTSIYPIIYCVFLGITAGLFEEIGRFLGFKIFRKNNLSWGDGVAFGIGHGGIEAIIFGGIANLQNLIIVISSSNCAKAIMNANSIRTTIQSLNSMVVLLGGIERLSAIIIHVVLSLLVLYGIQKNNKKYLILAILVHGIIDSVVGILSNLGVNIYLIEIWCLVCSMLLLIFAIKFKYLFKGDVVKNEKII